MKIYLVRHAHCVGAGPGVGEFDRYLTLEGRQAARRSGQIMAEQRAEVSLILTSPLVRAVQTAELMAAELAFGGEVRTCADLAPGAPPKGFLRELARIRGEVLAVGHAPDMRARAAALLGLALREMPLFTRAMILCLEGEERRSLSWAFLPTKGEVVESLSALRSALK